MASSSLPPERLISELARELDGPTTAGLILTGSFVRGDQTPYSDLDLDLYVDSMSSNSGTGPRIFYRDGYLVSVVTTTIDETRAGFSLPAEAIFSVPGIRNARILLDRDGALAHLKEEANDFTWGPLQRSANEYASRRLVKDAEGIHKLLGGLSTGDQSTVAYTIAWLIRGNTDAIAVRYGLLVPSVNAYFRVVEEAMGVTSPWSTWHRQALGAEGTSSLAERASATLELYRETARLLRPILTTEQEQVVDGVLGLLGEYQRSDFR